MTNKSVRCSSTVLGWTSWIYLTLYLYPKKRMVRIKTPNTYAVTMEMLSDYFVPEVNTPYERYLFRRIRHEEGETVDSMVSRLRERAKTCDFTGSVDDEIRDQVVEKCRYDELRAKWLRKKTLTLKDVTDQCRAHEQAGWRAQEFKTATAVKSESVNQVFGKKRLNNNNNENACWRCGEMGHFAKSPHCKARKQKCAKCGHVGHLEVVCRTKTYKKGGHSQDDKTAKGGKVHKPQGKHKNGVNCVDENGEYAFAVSDNSEEVTFEVNVGGVFMSCLIDSGANCNVIDSDTWGNLKKQNIKCTSEKVDKNLYVYGVSEPIPVMGKFQADVSYCDKMIKAEFTVIKGKGRALLGRKSSTELGLLHIGPSVNAIHAESNSIFQKYPEVFDGVGKLSDYQAKLHIDESVKPVAQRLRRVPINIRGKLEDKLNELEGMGIIEKVEGPSPWVSPLVVVPKPSGEICICLDMRRANDAVIQERYPIPTVEEVLYELRDSTIFSKLDL